MWKRKGGKRKKTREGARWSFEKKVYEGLCEKRVDPNSQQRKKK